MKKQTPAAKKAAKKSGSSSGRTGSVRKSSASKTPASRAGRDTTAPTTTGRKKTTKKKAPAKAQVKKTVSSKAAGARTESSRVRELEARIRSLEGELERTREAQVIPEPELSDLETPSIPEKRTKPLEEDSLILDSADELEKPEESGAALSIGSYDEENDFLSPLGGMTQRRQELDRERADREMELGDESYWMICPKCGEHMSEHEFDNIKIERCESCGGLWIDKGETDLMLLFSDSDAALAFRTRGLLQ